MAIDVRELVERCFHYREAHARMVICGHYESLLYGIHDELVELISELAPDLQVTDEALSGLLGELAKALDQIVLLYIQGKLREEKLSEDSVKATLSLADVRLLDAELGEECRRLVKFMREMLYDLKQDRMDVIRLFASDEDVREDLDPTLIVRHVHLTHSDQHNDGKQSLVLTLCPRGSAAEFKVVYKPSSIEIDFMLVGKVSLCRDLGVDVLAERSEFQSFAQRFNHQTEATLEASLPTYKMLPRTRDGRTYGYKEFIHYAPVADLSVEQWLERCLIEEPDNLPGDRQAYEKYCEDFIFERLNQGERHEPMSILRSEREFFDYSLISGLMMAMCVALKIGDCHCENVIVASPDGRRCIMPFAIDLENAFLTNFESYKTTLLLQQGIGGLRSSGLGPHKSIVLASFDVGVQVTQYVVPQKNRLYQTYLPESSLVTHLHPEFFTRGVALVKGYIASDVEWLQQRWLPSLENCMLREIPFSTAELQYVKEHAREERLALVPEQRSAIESEQKQDAVMRSASVLLREEARSNRLTVRSILKVVAFISFRDEFRANSIPVCSLRAGGKVLLIAAGVEVSNEYAQNVLRQIIVSNDESPEICGLLAQAQAVLQDNQDTEYLADPPLALMRERLGPGSPDLDRQLTELETLAGQSRALFAVTPAGEPVIRAVEPVERDRCCSFLRGGCGIM